VAEQNSEENCAAAAADFVFAPTTAQDTDWRSVAEAARPAVHRFHEQNMEVPVNIEQVRVPPVRVCRFDHRGDADPQRVGCHRARDPQGRRQDGFQSSGETQISGGRAFNRDGAATGLQKLEQLLSEAPQ